MAVNRKRLMVGAATTALVIAALGAGIGTADAGTRGPWWGSKPPKAGAPASPSAAVSRSAAVSPSAAVSRPAAVSPSATGAAGSAGRTPPPAGAGFDYQIGGAYTPPPGVTVVSRDSEAAPAAGAYNICYVNAFQAQPGTESWWRKNHPDLLLRDRNGELVVDEDWDELMLDFSTEAKRTALTAVAGGWIDRCAAKGFQAVEADNLDSYTRSKGLLTQSQAIAYATALNSRAHAKGLASGQKNTAELSSANARRAGFDFAVAEECAEWDECDAYTAAYGDNVIVIEYSRSGFTKACKAYGGRLSIVLRDVDVTTPGSGSYVHEAC